MNSAIAATTPGSLLHSCPAVSRELLSSSSRLPRAPPRLRLSETLLATMSSAMAPSRFTTKSAAPGSRRRRSAAWATTGQRLPKVPLLHVASKNAPLVSDGCGLTRSRRAVVRTFTDSSSTRSPAPSENFFHWRTICCRSSWYVLATADRPVAMPDCDSVCGSSPRQASELALKTTRSAAAAAEEIRLDVFSAGASSCGAIAAGSVTTGARGGSSAAGAAGLPRRSSAADAARSSSSPSSSGSSSVRTGGAIAVRGNSNITSFVREPSCDPISFILLWL
mmetsp:Transcript_28289/g.71190  ORF Transcript_28289/g.71190 Transcript_28289/m.71190 type:complete len:279 (-) Transcript_28289:29-865(-)